MNCILVIGKKLELICDKIAEDYPDFEPIRETVITGQIYPLAYKQKVKRVLGGKVLVSENGGLVLQDDENIQRILFDNMAETVNSIEFQNSQFSDIQFCEFDHSERSEWSFSLT